MSRTVTVTVAAEVPSAGKDDPFATTVERLALGGAAVKVTSAVATAVDPTVAVIVSVPRASDDALPVASPFASVGPGCTSVAPPDEESVTVAPWTGFPYAS